MEVTRLKRCENLTWVSAVAAGVNLTLVAVVGPYSVSLSSLGIHSATALFVADPTTSFLLLLIAGVGAMVQSFSLRYLQGDSEAVRFFFRTGVVLCAMSVVVTASLLVVVVAAWVVVGWEFPRVVGYRRGSRTIESSVRTLRRIFAVGDSALVLAAVVILWRLGSIGLSSATVLEHDSRLLGSWSTLVALLIVVAALVRSAQFVFSFWLPTTVAAPTPVSALLHAGIVNGGGILLIRLGPLSTNSVAAMVVAFVSAAITAVGAFAIMRTRADIKGSLVYSTMSQMGFMVAECAVGLPFAALLHLFGHGIYKATLFFRSGTTVPRLGERTVVASSRVQRWRVTALTSVATAALSGVALVIIAALHQSEPGVLVAFLVGSFALGNWFWFSRRPRSAAFTLAWLVFLGIAGALYALVLAVGRSWMEASLVGSKIEALSPWWLLSLLALGLLLSAGYSKENLRRRIVPRVAALGNWAIRDVTESGWCSSIARNGGTPLDTERSVWGQGEGVGSVSTGLDHLGEVTK
jgi:NADH:ubiquinone oxidoreductase subunit 5 (subunit L)/multisubunit Na+/H+ antiporter MnhA subunit